METIHKTITPRGLATRNRILKAAETMLNSAPYSELSMTTLAKKAKISVGGVYSHFESREALLSEVYENYKIKRDLHLSKVINSDDKKSLNERIKTTVISFVDLHYNNAGVIRSYILDKWINSSKEEISNEIKEVEKWRIKIYEFIECSFDVNYYNQKKIKDAVEYIISISKDTIIVKPNSWGEISTINTEELKDDIHFMVMQLLKKS